MIQQSKILFYLLASKQTSKGASVIYCRLVLNNQRKQFSTGLSISTKEWDKIKQRAKGKNPVSESINLHLNQIRNKLTEAETKLILEIPDNYSLNDIYTSFHGEYEENSPTLL